MISMKQLAEKIGITSNNEETRAKWVKATLQSLPGGLRILDAGAGEQQYKSYCSHLTYVAQDFGEYDGTGDGVGLQTGDWNNSNLDIVSDISSIPQPDSSFDVILCTEVFEHIPHPLDALKEFSRLLKPGGYLILTAPFCSFTHFAPYHFYTGYNTYFYEYHLPKNGFEITEITANGNFFEYVSQEVARTFNISEQYTTKKPRLHEILSMYFVVKMLKRFSKLDKTSSTLSCYGYHVRAVKI
jgi:SAM-dependent methyltransferase